MTVVSLGHIILIPRYDSVKSVNSSIKHIILGVKLNIMAGLPNNAVVINAGTNGGTA
jgi:hypothetical protein